MLDGSGSMQHYIGDGNRPLADNVNVSVRDFLGFFKNSSIKNNFSIAVVTFDDNATIHTPITPLEDIDDYADYNPVNNGHGGRTFIGGALQKAEELAKEFLSSPEALQNSIDHKVSIIVLSDGLCLKSG
ncbi:vWA domain-containing protein [Sphingobacterium daejeonense]|uniref:vWA domain-containing protein n=1 Tax=Sphingobacterium daejeonense TaxID=371142 RepID=UPI0021D3D28E|nr:vWA domain-containing protein [Sphingobacterium daejeonense]